jgi:hypothetical protein
MGPSKRKGLTTVKPGRSDFETRALANSPSKKAL